MLSYAVFALGTLKIIPFSQITLIFLLSIFALFNALLLFRQKKEKTSSSSLYFIVFEEIVFVVSLLGWAYIRGQEPSIRGLEKFMDFGFINSIIRSAHFPPLDIW